MCCLASQRFQAAAVATCAGRAPGPSYGLVVPSPGVSAPQAGVCATPSVSGTWLGTAVNGVRSGVLVNAPYIGVAAATFWFSGWAPRICSIVRTSVICE